MDQEAAFYLQRGEYWQVRSPRAAVPEGGLWIFSALCRHLTFPKADPPRKLRVPAPENLSYGADRERLQAGRRQSHHVLPDDCRGDTIAAG